MIEREATSAKAAVVNFHNHHSRLTWNAGTPGIEPWLRDTLVALQEALYKVADVQIKLAKQVDVNAENIDRIIAYINQQRPSS
jgi:hypothetical protein